MKTNWGSGGIAPLISDLGTIWRLVVIFTPRPLYPPEKESLETKGSTVPWSDRKRRTRSSELPCDWQADVPAGRRRCFFVTARNFFKQKRNEMRRLNSRCSLPVFILL